MSFIVSFNGQFSPYKLPDLSHYDHLHKTFKADSARTVKDKLEEDEKRLVQDFGEQKRKVEATAKYLEEDKNFKLNKIPHYARDIMSRPVHFCLETDTHQEIWNKMKELKHRHLPVMNKDDVLVGIISDRDLLKHQDNKLAKDIMCQRVITTLDTTRIQEIAKIMLHEKIGAIPVINHKNVLIGIVSTTDILRFCTSVLPLHGLA